MLKTIVFFLCCLVSSIFVGCGDPTPLRNVVHETSEIGYVQAAPLYRVVIPDSVQTAVIWDRNSQLHVNTIFSKATVTLGDTIISGEDYFLSMEMDRVQMSLDIAEAVNDTFAMDSLLAILSDSSCVHITSSVAGTMQYTIHQGSILQPGDTIALVTGAPPDSVYIMYPSYTHIRWPENLNNGTVTGDGLQCYGPLPGEAVSFPGAWSLRPQFIYENALESFLCTADGDTIPVIVMGSTDTSKIIYSVLWLDSIALSPW